MGAYFASGIWQGIEDAANTAAEFLGGVWADVSGWFSANVFEPIASAASSAWQTVSEWAGQAWSQVVSFFAPAAAWFISTVWSPISSGVQSVYNSIVNAFNNALATVKGAWSGISGWFESNVIQPVSNAFSRLRAIGASITGLKGSGGGNGYWTGTTSFVPAYASGGIASFADGGVAHGLAQVNEHGGELIDLPQGSRIYPAATTERLIERQLEREAPAAPSINISGNNFTVREEADIDKIAHAIVQQILQAEVNYGGAF